VEVSHNEEAKGDGDDAKKLDVVVRADAMGEVFRDLPVEDDTSPAGGEDEEANNESAKIKLHRYIIYATRSGGKGLKF